MPTGGLTQPEWSPWTYVYLNMPSNSVECLYTMLSWQGFPPIFSRWILMSNLRPLYFLLGSWLLCASRMGLTRPMAEAASSASSEIPVPPPSLRGPNSTGNVLSRILAWKVMWVSFAWDSLRTLRNWSKWVVNTIKRIKWIFEPFQDKTSQKNICWIGSLIWAIPADLFPEWPPVLEFPRYISEDLSSSSDDLLDIQVIRQSFIHSIDLCIYWRFIPFIST